MTTCRSPLLTILAFSGDNDTAVVFSSIFNIGLDLLPVVKCTIPLAQPMMVLTSQAPHVVLLSSAELTAPPGGSVGRGNDDGDNMDDGRSMQGVNDSVVQP